MSVPGVKPARSIASTRTAIADSLHGDASRGEAVFRLGQWHYAAGEYRLAIPRFREYLLHYPRGPWRNPAAYWMGYSCLQLVRQYPAKKVYLDTGLHYVEGLESRGRPKGYYLPLALTIKVNLDGKEVSSYTTDKMIFTAQHYIAKITQYTTLWPGDVLWLGVDNATIPDLQDGMVCDVIQDDIGVLRNPVARAKA